VPHINNVTQQLVACAQSAGELLPILNPPFDHLGDRHFQRRELLIGVAGLRTSDPSTRLPTEGSNTRRILAVGVVPRERVGARRGAYVDCTVLLLSVGGIARARRHAPGLSPANLRNSLLK
jgi:hypothetical protein